MAMLKRVSIKFLWIQVAMVLVKTCWHSIPLLEGKKWPLFAEVMVGLQVATVSIFYLAKPGKAKESHFWLKMYGVILAVDVAQHIMSLYSYHQLWPREEVYPAILARYAVAHHEMDYDRAHSIATTVEAVIDVLVLVVLGVPAFLLNRYIGLEQDAKKLREREPAMIAAKKEKDAVLEMERTHQRALERAKEMAKKLKAAEARKAK